MPEQWPNAGRRITIERTDVVQSPAFRAHYPRIINEELIHHGPGSKMRESWNQSLFPARGIDVFRISAPIVAGECLILDRDLQVIENASDRYLDSEVNVWLAAIRAAKLAGGVQQVGGLTILAKRRAVHNYGHFLIEMLPMAVLASRLAQNNNARFLIHQVPAPSMDFTLRALRLFGIDLNNVLIQDEKPLLFAELLVVRGLSQHGSYMSPICIEALDQMASRLVDVVDGTRGEGAADLFVRRVPGWKRGRDLHNEGEICRRLSDRGFTIIEPGSMTLEQQIIQFRRARNVVGVCGAAMTNIAFCRPGTKVTVLVPGTFPDTFFWFIAQHKELDYVEIRGDQTSYEGIYSWDAGFTIRDKDIDWIENVRSRE